MKRNENGAVEFEYETVRCRLTEEEFVAWNPHADSDGGWIHDWALLYDMVTDETGRALLAEAIDALDHPYSGVTINIPPQHRATPRGNK